MLLWGFLLLPRLPGLEYRYNTERGYLVLPASLLVSPIDWHVLALISVAGRKVPHTDLTHLGFLFSRRGDGRH